MTGEVYGVKYGEGGIVFVAEIPQKHCGNRISSGGEIASTCISCNTTFILNGTESHLVHNLIEAHRNGNSKQTPTNSPKRSINP